MSTELIKIFVAYHLAMTRRVWIAVEAITEEQFLADDVYSRGSIRNLLVHLTSTDRRWLAGLKDLPEVGHLNFGDYPTRESARAIFEQVAADLDAYVNTLTETELNARSNGIPNPRWTVLLHLVNHGTDHRATVLQKLTELGVPTFDQDFILWMWSKKQ